MKKKDLVKALEQATSKDAKKGKSVSASDLAQATTARSAKGKARVGRDVTVGRMEIKPVMPPPKNPTKKGGSKT